MCDIADLGQKQADFLLVKKFSSLSQGRILVLIPYLAIYTTLVAIFNVV